MCTCGISRTVPKYLGTNRTRKGNLPRRLGREGHRRGRTSLNRTCTRHRAESACPRGWTVCGRQQRKESRSGSPLCSTISTWIYSATASTRFNAKASPGIDGVTWAEYETGLEDRLVDLHSRVHRGVYRAKPSRRVFIPKADGRQRPLGIAALEDKIVQQAVVTILNQIY